MLTLRSQWMRVADIGNRVFKGAYFNSGWSLRYPCGCGWPHDGVIEKIKKIAASKWLQKMEGRFFLTLCSWWLIIVVVGKRV